MLAAAGRQAGGSGKEKAWKTAAIGGRGRAAKQLIRSHTPKSRCFSILRRTSLEGPPRLNPLIQNPTNSHLTINS